MGPDVCLRHRTWSVFFFPCHQAVSRNATDAQQNTRHTYIRGDEVLRFVPFLALSLPLFSTLSLDLTRQHSGDLTQNEVRCQGRDSKGGEAATIHTLRAQPDFIYLKPSQPGWARSSRAHSLSIWDGSLSGERVTQSPRFAQVASYWLPPSVERRCQCGVSPNRGIEELLYKLRLVVVWGFSLGLNRVSLRLRG